MKNIRLLSLAALAAFTFTGCQEDMVLPDENMDSPDQVQEEAPAVIPGEAIVYFSDEMIELIESDLADGNLVTKSSDLNYLTESIGITSMTRLFPHAGKFEERTRAEGLHKWYKVKYDQAVPMTKATSDLSSFPGIEIVEEVRSIQRTDVFNDPKFGQQWHYYNTGSLHKSHAAGADINVLPVWENYTTGNPDVIVAIVDGGIDYAHEDLKDNYLGGYNFIHNTSKIVPHDHGTHVAGTVAAVNNNGIGVAGVAGGDKKNNVKGVKLLSCQIFEPNPDNPNRDLSGSGAAAIKWGADNGAVIAQNSWGYVYETDAAAEAATIPASDKAAIDYFIKYAGYDQNGKQVGPMAGGVVIFAAGNDSRAHNPIGKYDPVISVGSISPDFTRAYYSNYGDWVDLAAPGGSVDYTYGQILSTTPGNTYGYMQGTSMACPHVSGVAALVVSYYAGAGFTNTTLREKLINGANTTALSKNAKIGALVDAFGAMTYGGTTPPEPVTSMTIESYANNIRLTWKVTSDKDDKRAYGYTIFASKNKESLNSLNYNSLPADVISSTVFTGDLKVNDEITGVVSGLEFEQDYHVAVVAFDYNKNYSALSSISSVATGPNNPPTVTTSYEGDYGVKSHETLKVQYAIADPDDHAVTIQFTSGSSADSWTQLPDGSYQIQIVGNMAEPGDYTAKVTVTDEYGYSVEYPIAYKIYPNHAPEILKNVDDMLFVMAGQKMTLDMAQYLYDPDGEQLAFDIKVSDPTVLHINPAANILYATTLSYGITDVIITAFDSRGLKCTLTFRVAVKDPSTPVSVYPNPVKDFVNVSTMDAAETNVKIVSSTGKVVYDQTGEVSAFYPARVDMMDCAPGVYDVTVTFGGTSYKNTIVKL